MICNAVLGLLLCLSLSSWGESAPTPAPLPPSELARADLPGEVDRDVLRAIEDLDHPDWRHREEATSWLITHAEDWVRSIPESWGPDSPEARWRWEHVLDRVEQLDSLPTTLRQRYDLRTQGRLSQLAAETGSAFLDALERCLEHPDARVRSASVEWLGVRRAGCARLERADLGRDPSARVRESLYEVARTHDHEWAFDLLRQALAREESNPLTRVTATAARRLGDPRLLPLLRRRFVESTAPHPEIVLALAAYGRAEDSAAVEWLLRSPEYRHVSAALDALGSSQVRDHAPAVSALLTSEHWDLRVRALGRLEECDPTSAPFRLLPLLENEDEDVYRFAVENLVRVGGEDYLGDIEASLTRWPLARRPFVIANEGGRPVPRRLPALDRTSAGAIVPAISPGGPGDRVRPRD